MPAYNAYTKTYDFPLRSDFFPIDQNTGKVKPLFKWTALDRSNVNTNYSIALQQWIIKYNIPKEILEEWNKRAQELANASQQEQESWWQKIADKVTNTVNNFVQQAGNVLQSAGENALLAPLLPFKIAMVNALKRQGENVTLNTKLGTIASLFKQKIIDRSSKISYEHNEEGSGLTTDQILQLIDKIIPFFTLILEKVKSGTATSDEKLINDDAEEEAGKLTGGGAPTTTGVNAPTGDDWFTKYKWVIIGAVAVVLFLAFRKNK
jgi:hypothetical protein